MTHRRRPMIVHTAGAETPVSRPRHDRPMAAVCLALLLVGLRPAAGGGDIAPGEAVPYTGLNAAELEALKGTKLTIYLRAGKELKDMEALSFRPGKKAGSLQEFAFKPADGKGARRTLRPAAVERIVADDKLYTIVGDGKKDPWRLVDVARREALVDENLRSQGQRLWPKLSETERTARVKEQKQFLKKVEAAYPNHPFELHETEYFLFLTDMPRGDVGPFIADLDKMYLVLGRAFGVPKGENIWWGKAPVLAFAERNDFVHFEQKFMNYTVTDAQGLHHGSSDGDVVIACYRGRDPAFFASVLVHETAHGYLHRYRSTVHVLAWINEGVADWVAGSVVTASGEVSRRQLAAAEQIKRTGTLGQFFDGEHLDPWQYGVASSLVDLLVKIDAGRYRTLIDGIKEGQTWEESLKNAYGLTPAELTRIYGQRISIPNLSP